MIGDIVGGIGQAVGKIFEIPAARKSRNKAIDAQNKATELQKQTALASLSLEERMVRVVEDEAMQSAAAAQAQPSAGLNEYLPWLVLACVGAWLLMRK